MSIPAHNMLPQLTSALSLAILAVMSTPAIGADVPAWPARPIRIISNYTPGGTTDFVARAMAQKIADATGGQAAVENKPSTNGVIGTSEVTRAAPNGYTLLFSTSGHTSVSKALLGDRLPFDPFKDITPVSPLVNITQLLIVHPSLGVKNVPEFVKLVKAHPGKYSYGSAGNGSPNHLGVELLKHVAGIDLLHIPYKGGSQAIVDLSAGRIQFMLNAMVSVLPYVKSGKAVAIGVGTAKRSPGAPDVPTVAEQGYPDYESYTWYAMFAPPGLPREITLRLNAILNEALTKPDIIKTFTAQGAEPAGGTPEDLAHLVRSDYERWRKVVVTAKIQSD